MTLENWQFFEPRVLFTGVLCAAVCAACLVALVRPAPVQAVGLVTDCSNDLDFSAKLASGGLVTFACPPNQTLIVLSGAKTIALNTTIEGGDVIVLSGNGSTQLFGVNSGVALALNHITIFDGHSSGDGGAIFNRGALSIDHSQLLNNHSDATGAGGAIVSYGPLTITNSTLAYNSAGNGGALYPRFAPARTLIVNSVLHENSTTNTTDGWGGALLAWDGAPVSIDHSTLYSNTARYGGALRGIANTVFTLTNVTLSGNSASSGGGGFYNDGTAAVNNSTLNDNAASLGPGGGIYNGNMLLLTNSTLSGNSSGVEGGGIYNGSMLTLTNSTLSGNSAFSGGGGMANYGPATLKDSTLSDNHANTGHGGGINNGSMLTLNNSTLNGNSAAAGGGIYNGSMLLLTNSTLSGNSVHYFGGGIDNDQGTVLLTSSTLSGNFVGAGGFGGGIYHSGTSASQTISLKNTIVANSPSGGGCFRNPNSVSGSTIVSVGYNLSSDYSCQTFLTQRTDVPPGFDPNLGPLANNGGLTRTHAPLAPDSPGIDKIPMFANGCGTTLTTDQRGGPRPINAKCDIGSVEFGASFPWLYLPLVRR